MLLNALLLGLPVAVALDYLAPDRHLWIFAAAGLAIVPLAGWMGRATEALAEHAGEGIGGLLNATFGNAAELIIGISALRAGLHGVVKASIAGSIVGNLLLVLGAAMLAGGLRRDEQRFNAVMAQSQATLLFLAAVSLIAPAAYHYATGVAGNVELGPLSVSVSVVLLFVYGLNLLFSLGTHRQLFAGPAAPVGVSAPPAHDGPGWSVPKALGVLAVATALIAWMSEVLVAAVRPAATELGLNDAFVGVFVVAVLGNAAEHATAVSAAMKDRMDLALAIAIGSSVQIALFVAPVLVLASYVVGQHPMDLVLGAGLVLSILLAVVVTGQVAADGRCDWLEGVQLLAVYVLLGLTFFFLPI